MRASPFRRFAVRGVFWREYLDWAILNLPFYFQPPLLLFFTLFFYFFAGSTRRALVANLGVALAGSSAAINHLRAFRVLYNFGWTIAEAATHKLNGTEFDYEIIGAQLLEQLGAARGAIVLTAHMGSYDLGAALFAQKFQRELRTVRAPEADTDTEEHLRASVAKSAAGAVKINYNTAGPMLAFDLLHALRQGEVVSIQGDRAAGAATDEARLFGRSVRLPNGPFILALVARAPIYPLFIARTGYRRYAIIVREPIAVLKTEASRDEALAGAMAKWCAVLEELVAEHWDQWFAFEPLFNDAHAVA